ncbi:uncharacterized protein B4U79_05770, partial [Dinothrombium tinctorium]
CRYTKGEWSECRNGNKTRNDTLKLNGGSNFGCEPWRITTKKCKQVCRYEKADWSPCEDGIKTKTLSLAKGEPKECEPSKVITKQCVQQNKRAKHGRQRGRKANPSTPA